jgi:hypothetical protein
MKEEHDTIYPTVLIESGFDLHIALRTVFCLRAPYGLIEFDGKITGSSMAFLYYLTANMFSGQ